MTLKKKIKCSTLVRKSDNNSSSALRPMCAQLKLHSSPAVFFSNSKLLGKLLAHSISRSVATPPILPWLLNFGGSCSPKHLKENLNVAKQRPPTHFSSYALLGIAQIFIKEFLTALECRKSASGASAVNQR